MFYCMKYILPQISVQLQTTVGTNLATEQRCSSSTMARVPIIYYIRITFSANSSNLCFSAL